MGARSPSGIGFHHGIVNREQFAHACRQRDLPGLSGGDEAFMEDLDGGVVPGGGRGGHVQRGADGRPTSPEHAVPLESAAVPSEGSHDDERGDLPAVEGAALGPIADERAAGDSTDPGLLRRRSFFARHTRLDWTVRSRS